MRRSTGSLLLLPLALPAALMFSVTQRSTQLPQLRGQGRLAGVAAATARTPKSVLLRAEYEEPAGNPELAKEEDVETVVDLDEPAKGQPFQGGFEMALLGTYGLIIFNLIPLAGRVFRAAKVPVFKKAAIAGAVKYQMANLQGVQVFVVAALALRVLNSAASRDRLSGTTFKVLALGLASGFGVLFSNSLYVAAKLALGRLMRRSLPLMTLGSNKMSVVMPQLGLALLTLFTAFNAFRACYGTLQEYGVPKFKMSVKSKESAMLSLLALAYFVTTMHSLWWGAILTMYSSFKTVGALRCFVVAACAHVCQGAAVAGKKRLSSATYTTLNLALMFDAAARLGSVVLLRAPQPLWIPAIIALFASTVGLVVGKTYSGK